MSIVERWVKHLPGNSHTQPLAAALLITFLTGIPYFMGKPEDNRQGHQFFSSDRPEAITAQQEQARRDLRLKQAQQEQQQQQQ